MLKPSLLKSSLLQFGTIIPVRILPRLLFLVVMACPLTAFGQLFTMVVTQPYPSAVDAGHDSSAYINLGIASGSGFSGTVSLSCAVTPVNQFVTCTPPSTATPPEQVAMSITVDPAAPAGFYTLAVTGSAVSGMVNQSTTVPISLTVLSGTAASDYTLAVTTTIFPTSVHAGFTATATVTVTPVSGYTGTVTFSCSAITPVATPAPSCSFSPAAVTVPAETSSVLTITTTGPTAPPPTTASLPGSINRINGSWLREGKLSGVWLTFCGMSLTVVVLIASGRRRRTAWAISLLLAAAALLLMPACSAPNNSNTGLNGSTPKNTYVFTLTGADTNGVAPSNEATPPTVSLTVN